MLKVTVCSPTEILTLQGVYLQPLYVNPHSPVTMVMMPLLPWKYQLNIPVRSDSRSELIPLINPSFHIHY